MATRFRASTRRCVLAQDGSTRSTTSADDALETVDLLDDVGRQPAQVRCQDPLTLAKIAHGEQPLAAGPGGPDLAAPARIGNLDTHDTHSTFTITDARA